MADVSTSYRYLWKIFLLLGCLAVSRTLSEDVELSFPQAHLDTAVEYDLLHNNRFRREIIDSNTSTPLPPEATTTSSKPPVDPVDKSSPVPETTTVAVTTVAVTTAGQTTTQSPTSTEPSKEPQTTTTANSNPSSTTIKSKIIEDSHSYYSSKIVPNQVNDHWIDLPSNRQHSTLSKNYRTAVTIDLKFPFRFYGHNITNVTVATGGFLYTSPFLHQWLTATQYIAPLMANFDTRKGGDDSAIYYDSYDDKFIVQWKSVKLGDENITEPFEFEVILTKDGTIKFLYKTIPVNVDEISDSSHPVKIGLSDAFYIDTYFKEKGIRRRTIYEYHRVAFNGQNVQSGTVIILTPLPTCNTIDNCGECATHVNVAFQCRWCNKVNRCSDGIDWHRQTWLEKGCKDKKTDLTCPDPTEGTRTSLTSTTKSSSTLSSSPSQTKLSSTVFMTTKLTSTATPSRSGQISSKSTVGTTATTPVTPSKTTTSVVSKTTRPSTTKITNTAMASSTESPKSNTETVKSYTGYQPGEKAFPIAAVIAIIIVLVLISALCVWLYYAYTHPTSASGMWLLENRPSRVKEKLSKMQFFKKSTPAGTQYQVESTA